MTLTLTSALSLFVLIALSSAVFFAAKRFKIPYTVLLVLVGLLLVPVVNLPYLNTVFGFLDDLVLTPELLFYIFLPVLIFESAFNMKIRKMLDSSYAIAALSVVSLVVSTVAIGGALYFIMPLIGFSMPFIVTLLFGAIISATDPVAVLSLFKEAGVPRRLAMVFEGESLFNDGTAMALFLVLLGVAVEGFHGTETIAHGIFDFAVMIVMGIVIGLAMAAMFSRALQFTKKNEFVTVTLILISAHLVFITSELINHAGLFHVSPIIATTVAALFLGNYSRNVLAPNTDEYLSKLIEHMAFVVNSLVFLLAGLLFASSGVDFGQLWLPIVVTVLVVAAARVIAVYIVTKPLNALKIEQEIPSSWQRLLAWGSLRGALSIIIVLMIPETFTVDGWTIPYSPRDFLLALTIGCILATLFIKAPMIVPIMRRYKISSADPFKDAHEADLGIYYLLTEKSRLVANSTRGFLTAEQYADLCRSVGLRIEEAEQKRADLIDLYGADLFDQSLHLSMVHVEKTVLKQMFINDEVGEKTFRRIYSKLSLQQEMIETACHNDIDPKIHGDRKDVFDRLVAFVQSPFDRKRNELTPVRKLQYYRAQMIMARKAVEAIERMQTEYDYPVFLKQSYDRVVSRYQTYCNNSGAKLEALVEAHKEELAPYLADLAQRRLSASGALALSYLRDNGLVNEEMEHELVEAFEPGKAHA